MRDKKIVKAIERAMPAVVSIVITKNLADLEKEVPHELSHLFSKKKSIKRADIPESLIDGDGRVRIGGGSGFIVDPSGLIVTNKHVVSDSDAEHTVILNDGRRFEAEILSRDPINDVAILKIQASRLPTLTLGDTHKLKLGQLVLAIGNALGLFKNTVSLGIVSGLSRAVVARAEPGSPPQEMRGLIQTDAAINLGNSGGPLITLDRMVVGINTATVSGADSIGFAIPINAVKRDLADLKKFGRILRPLLGVRYLTIDDTLQKKLDLPVNYGALIVREGPTDHAVVPDSPASEAGLEERDIILEFNNEPISSQKSIQDFLGELAAGDTVILKILRKGRTFQAKVRLVERK